MSGINPLYLLSPPLWEVFTDKDLLTFLNNGYVLFFKDLQRTVGKPVYMISGTPPNYTYAEYGSLQGDGSWKVPLNAQGAFDDALYLFPYDANGNNENYFIEWYSSTGVLQNTREAWPNLPTTGGTGSVINSNLVPNPQFLLHTLIPKSGANRIGQITQAITPFAYGGWTYERSNASSAIDTITYLRNGSPITNPAGNPRYWAVLTCVTPGSDSFKRICLTFNDVNKFANSGQQYTFAFNAYGGAPLSVSLQIIQNFGSGGSAPITTTIATFAITTANQQYLSTFTFPDTTGNTIGVNDDDFMQIVLSVPATSAMSFYITDVILTDETISSPVINDQPDSVYVYQSTAGFLELPAYDGSDVYLPIILTPTGFGYDKSQIGVVQATFAQSVPAGFLACDGTQYKTDGISSDGIPYSRLQEVLYDEAANVPITGTGVNFVTAVAYTVSAANVMTLFTNILGAVSTPANGAVSPAFTYQTVNTPITHNLVNAYYGGTNLIFVKNITPGLQNPSDFSNSDAKFASDHNSGCSVYPLAYSPNVRGQFIVETIAGNAITGGHYWYFKTPTHSFYVWYKVDGAGSDPAPSEDYGIEVDILSTYSAADVARITALCINAFQIFNITMGAASTIAQSSWFTFTTLPSNNYYVWYNINSGGTDPAPGGIGIQVPILSTDTATQVLAKTIAAINSTYFCVPDARGAILRGLDTTTGNFDPDTLNRFSNNFVVAGSLPATYEFDENQQHGHYFYNAGSGGAPNYDAASWSNTEIVSDIQGDLSTGSAESRPYNIAVNYIIKY